MSGMDDAHGRLDDKSAVGSMQMDDGAMGLDADVRVRRRRREVEHRLCTCRGVADDGVDDGVDDGEDSDDTDDI